MFLFGLTYAIVNTHVNAKLNLFVDILFIYTEYPLLKKLNNHLI